MIGNLREVKDFVEVLPLPPHHATVSPMLTVVPLQLYAYYVALSLGYDIDKPRNLANSVTVM
jgi:glutamine---fructose-6-phosphate transaminase (isomerizing)